MSVGTHIAEVVRQGIWASLTGGWYYEPGFSIFCNTLHLYVWFVLVVLPLVLGLVSTQGVSIVFAVSYTVFIVIFFAVLKSAVAYLHMVFDTTDPIVVTRTINDSISEIYREANEQAEPTTDGELIELHDMGYNLRGSERALDNRRDFLTREERDMIASHQAHARRHYNERLLEIHRESCIPNQPISSKFWDFGPPTSASSHASGLQELRKALNTIEDESTETEGSEGPSTSSARRLNKKMRVVYEDEQDRQEGSFPPPHSPISRKRSMPSEISEFPENLRRIGPQKRRMSDPAMRNELEITLEEVKRTVLEYGRSDEPSTSSGGHSSRRRPSRRRSSTGTTNSAGKKRNAKRAGSPAVFAGKLVKKDSHESSRSMPTSVGWTPVVVSLGDVDRPTTTSRYSADDADAGADIRGEITKFLEDLIDKHPETLDAIESVRMSRLGLGRPESHEQSAIEAPPVHSSASHVATTSSASASTSAGPSTSSATHSGADRLTHGIFSVPHVLRNAARSNSFIDWHAHSQVVSTSQHHIAQTHEDTSQGAVHTFQDEDGNWWTYTFDENSGVGTAQPLGSGRAVLELINRERDKNPEAARKLFPTTELEVLPENMYDSTEDEKGEKTSDEDDVRQRAVVKTNENNNNNATPGELMPRREAPLTRRERALSSSSNESSTYMPTLPSSVFHAATGTGATRASSARGSQLVCFSSAGSRLRNAIRDADERSADGMWQMEQIMELIENTHGRRSEVQGILDRRNSGNVRKSYYYPMKMFPTAQKNFDLKVDRMSVERLFDRNRTIWSLLFDILLAAVVSLLAVLLIDARIFFDYSLVVFCFVVASAQFSLLKSVQPDACSPIHGFNWIAAYNRPVYFCIIALGLLALHNVAEVEEAELEMAWNWNPFRLHMMPSSAILLAAREFVSILLLLLPVAFTLGWLPQFNTLTHHVAEQIEMHVFGGTASFGVLSACIQLAKSCVFYAALCVLCHVAYTHSPTSTQSPLFSIFAATSVAVSYLLSRMSSDQNLMLILFDVLCSPFRKKNSEDPTSTTSSKTTPSLKDEMPRMVRRTVAERARYDLLFSVFLVVFFFGIHSTSLFTSTQPYFTRAIAMVCVVIGVVNHYIYPQFRTHTPWSAVSSPLLKSAEHGQFESPDAAKLMYFEAIHLWMVAIERNIVYPLLVISIITENSWSLPAPCVLLPLIAIRLLRGGFSAPQLMYIPIAVSCLAAKFDLEHAIRIELEDGKLLTAWNLLPIIMFLAVVAYPKFVELYLKIAFIMAYVAPWQISWGSAFHAFAQPFSVPHSALIAIQTIVSSIISAPLNPFLGSSFFTASYVRPVKFWEKDYNTKRTDASTMRLASQIERGPMVDDSNLNAVFYEHLTRSLQKSLAGDLAMGRWATSVQPGDCFVLASFYLNSLVHIIEVGNGFVTFQLRGLEFRGTYCHQREVEAISEDVRDGAGFCCCSPGALPGLLSFNTAWGLRWLAWEVVSGKYIIDGYSISDNSAVNLLQVHELRRLLVTLYIKCIIYYTFTSLKFRQWLKEEAVAGAVKMVMENPKYTDVDSIFCATNDEDYDTVEAGISRNSFSTMYLSWITYCIEQQRLQIQEDEFDKEEAVTFCYLLSLVARRSLGTASFNRHSSAAESFLYGLHSLFKGDFRITCQRDEWVFTDMDMLRCVVSPAVKMALKLHQDHFAQFEEFDENDGLYTVIGEHETRMFISHEQDPGWRDAILANTPSLLALRHIYDDGQDDYKIIMLNQMHLNMRVIKLNRECVRAFWAGQQQELIFLRNRNPERGSIQNARQVLRNMINSSADLPVGYPIYVSPLTTSHIESHSQIHRVFGPTFTFEGFCKLGQNVWNRLRNHFGPSGSTSVHQQQQQQQQQQQAAPVPPPPPATSSASTSSSTTTSSSSTSSSSTAPPRAHFHVGPPPAPRISEEEVKVEEELEMMTLTMGATPRPARRLENSIVEMTKDGGARVSVLHHHHHHHHHKSTNEAAAVTLTAPPQTERERAVMNRPNLQTSLKTGLVINENRGEMGIGSWVAISDGEQIFKYLNEPLKSSGECLVVWPDELVQHMSGRASWLFQPSRGMAGKIVYTWYPSHPLRNRRSHVGDHIHLVSLPLMPNGLVPIAEKGLRLLAPQDINTLGLAGVSSQEQQEFQTRYTDVLILSKIVTGTVSARTSFPKKPPIPPPNSRESAATSSSAPEVGVTSSTTTTTNSEAA